MTERPHAMRGTHRIRKRLDFPGNGDSGTRGT